MGKIIGQQDAIREIDDQAYLGMLRELILEGREVSLLVTGNSMSPLIIHRRDTVILAPIQQPLKKGDIVFYQRDNGAYVLHRIYRVCPGERFDIIGDGQVEIEHGVRRDQIFARVTQISRKGKTISPGDFWWQFFAVFWLRVIPRRRFLLRVYGWIIGKGRHSDGL